jgi:hypothetical protein
MIFDYKLWEEEAVAILASTIASIYATILVCVYVAFAFTELVTYPHFKVSFIMLLSIMFGTIKTIYFGATTFSKTTLSIKWLSF